MKSISKIVYTSLTLFQLIISRFWLTIPKSFIHECWTKWIKLHSLFLERGSKFFFFNRKKSLQSLPHLLWSSAFLNIHKSIRVNSASDPNQPHFRLAHKNVPPKTLLEKNFFKIKRYDLTIIFQNFIPKWFWKFHLILQLKIYSIRVMTFTWQMCSNTPNVNIKRP